jgi:hypothetical protein
MQSSRIETLLLMRGNTGTKIAEFKESLRNTLGKAEAASYDREAARTFSKKPKPHPTAASTTISKSSARR